MCSKGFKVEVDYIYSDIEVGRIAKQSPEAETSLPADTTIYIYVSDGRAPVQVPSDLVGLDIDAVRLLLERDGFEVNIIPVYNAEVEENLVIAVPDQGNAMAYGSVIDVYVSLGEGSGMGSEDAEQKPDDGGSNDNPDDEPTITYEYNGFDIPAPEGATHYTYSLKDTTGTYMLEWNFTHTKIPDNRKVNIYEGGLTVSSGKIVITWYTEKTETDGTKSYTNMGQYTDDVTFYEE